ncbi:MULTISPECIES: T3SS effector HopA1 family protein [Streptomyces]|uniref:T3SS effector HopA1 family protein n=1 Tax=Streptomyces TaxID=1883 RepID=UPI001E5B4C09|nr:MULTISPECIES: T3SS effector HopA1 family protein [Streptomyces]UFQ16851.1 T3SS effector HopA1 family protein [Streptomyces huasconensis]WCL86454.1 T3SS effector HopA1 family protein [Streptomyces sp. JCM 35825]
MSNVLSDTLNSALDAIQIEETENGLSARIGERTVEADTALALRDRLTMLIYECLHAGRPELPGGLPRTLRDADLERLLTQATPHPTTVRRTRLLGSDAGQAIVELDGLRVRVPRETCTEAGPEGAVDVALQAVRPALSPGFFLADGSAGRPEGKELLRLYVHVTDSSYAPDVWNTVLTALEATGAPYRAKISSSPLLYPRRDALVVYLGSEALHVADAVVRAAAATPGLGGAVSPFTHELAPGLSCAWEPTDTRPGRSHMSFGEHRSAAVAEGLLNHVHTPTRCSRAEAVASALTQAGIDPRQPARDLVSPELPVLEGV